MVNVQYTNIRRVLDNIMDHPMLRDVSLEQAIRYTLRFIALHGYSKLYEDKIEDVEIHDFRGVLPCDLIHIIQVKDLTSHRCLRSMTDTFNPGQRPKPSNPPAPPEPPYGEPDDFYIPERETRFELSFKTQGRIIYTSFPEGKVSISYKAIKVDEDGFPLLIDNEVYLAALEAYIKKKVFTAKFDEGKIAAGVLQNAKRDYSNLAGQLRSEMEVITRIVNTAIPSMRHFDNGFKNLGEREYIRKH